MSDYGSKPATIPDITMFNCGFVDVCDHKQDQMALYFKIPNRKYSVGDSGYCREPGKMICVEDGHDYEF